MTYYNQNVRWPKYYSYKSGLSLLDGYKWVSIGRPLLPQTDVLCMTLERI